MKKLIFLLILAVFMVGFMPALNAAHPPGDTLGIEMSEYCVESPAVTSDTVLAMDAVITALPASFLVTSNYINDEIVDGPQGYFIKPINMNWQGDGHPPSMLEPDYFLRL